MADFICFPPTFLSSSSSSYSSFSFSIWIVYSLKSLYLGSFSATAATMSRVLSLRSLLPTSLLLHWLIRVLHSMACISLRAVWQLTSAPFLTTHGLPTTQRQPSCLWLLIWRLPMLMHVSSLRTSTRTVLPLSRSSTWTLWVLRLLTAGTPWTALSCRACLLRSVSTSTTARRSLLSNNPLWFWRVRSLRLEEHERTLHYS